MAGLSGLEPLEQVTESPVRGLWSGLYLSLPEHIVTGL